ncbi:crossover junction endodeoxyribonuclease RuvC [Caldisericum exile]|uniref:Crossover junction endodeoxyribonuclease RuvC n=1 Tax=Caldisericum exile (strain DSM 21853 / NBRC 104410 / AZM16c01) TaxID=511051 RepID=A0A7U6GF40_CALEA|nr:crossover junction endodeoxyribonuclease RuvC [Caldisericum exile]BAL81211.1 crossover junction endodeoxyribonuclease RuvC [Caldisericum exile AZM16c01]
MDRKIDKFTVLGVDPGVATTGFAIVEKEKDQINLIKYGVIKTNKNAELGERLGVLYKNLSEIFSNYNIDFVAVEKIFFNTNLKTVVSVSEARGVVLLSSFIHNKKVFEYTPLEAKKTVVGFGRASKSEIQDTLKAILNLNEPPKPDDAADAIALALCHIYSYNFYLKAQDD